jgi:hypothetical protein
MTKFAGLTKENCATACSEKGCVLAVDRPFCFHPCKGGLPKAFKDDPKAQALQAEAREVLGVKLTVLEGATQ